jgi:uncharacterized protein
MKSSFPYNSLNRYMRKKYGEKIMRIPLDMQQPCPHRVAHGGCTFCLPESYVPTVINEEERLAGQLIRGAEKCRQKYHAHKFVAYFQSGTNTAGSPEQLEKAYMYAANFPGVVAVSISTRPDYLSEEICEVIKRVIRKVDVWIELGVQTLNDATLQRVNRGHTAACALEAIEHSKEIGAAHVVAHIILGLPGDTQLNMRETVQGIADAGADGIKIHHLHVVRDTLLENEWREGKIKVFRENEYVECVVDILQHTYPHLVIHRLVGAAPDSLLVAPRWQSSTDQIVQKIQREMITRKTYQGVYAV